METNKQDIQKLISTQSRRLQKLKEQNAQKGTNTPPEVLIEIEDIEDELVKLQATLAAFSSPTETQHPNAPIVYIHTWGKAFEPLPNTLHKLIWNEPGKFQNFEDRSRTLPPVETWQKELLPKLKAQPGKVGRTDWVRLEGNCALSVGFVFGHIFHSKDRYSLEVKQYIPGTGTQYWTSTAKPPAGLTAPHLTSYSAINSQSGTTDDAIIVVCAIPGKSAQDILSDVGTYLNEPSLSQVVAGQTELTLIKGVLALEAKAATQDKRNLEGWEVAALAQSATRLINDFIGQINPKKLHLFLATPLSLAVFIGHHLYHVRKPGTLYEETNDDNQYAPLEGFTLS